MSPKFDNLEKVFLSIVSGILEDVRREQEWRKTLFSHKDGTLYWFTSIEKKSAHFISAYFSSKDPTSNTY